MSRYDNVKLIKSILFNTEGMDDDTYDRLCKTIDLEEVPQEDLEEDGELQPNEVHDKIINNIQNGEYLLMRECYACATQRHACEHDQWEDTSVHIADAVQEVMAKIQGKELKKEKRND